MDHNKTKEELIQEISELREKVYSLEKDKIRHRQIEEALNKSRLRFRELSRMLPETVFETDLRGNLTFVNEVAFQTFGFTKEDLKNNSSVLTVIAPENHEALKENIQKILQGNDTGSNEYTAVKKDGSKFPIIIHSSAIRHSGEIVGLRGVVIDITKIKHTEELIQKAKEALEIKVKESFDALQITNDKLERILAETIIALSSAVEKRDPYTAGHQQRVAQLASAIAQKITSLKKEQVQGIYMASIVHDVGKLYVPSEVLSKPARLTEVEFSLIKTHPKVGYDILSAIEFPWPIAQIVLQHHERINGSGYPSGLKGDEILIEAKIIGTADVVEAMASHRPYRPARGIEEALKEVSDNKGILYDPMIVDICLELFHKENFKFK